VNTIRYWLERRRLRREIKRLTLAGEEERADQEGEPSNLAGPIVLYGLLEYERLRDKAHRLGIEFEHNPQLHEGYDADETGRLVGVGYPRLRRAISDERFRRVERWTKILVPLLTALTGLAGSVIGLLSFLRH
jgi:hypothetical protein